MMLRIINQEHAQKYIDKFPGRKNKFTLGGATKLFKTLKNLTIFPHFSCDYWYFTLRKYPS